MKLTNETIRKAKEIIEQLEDAGTYYGVYGLRVQDEVPFELGALSHQSSIWDDGNETGELLDGVSVVTVDAAQNPLVHEYYGGHLALVAGNGYTFGEDPGELVISDPVVIHIFS